ncbi:MAG: hypothetical protein E7123_06685 [Bacteroidales bacterium]|nr:hypothetical protein [Bacteroidales bacterium]
MKIFNNIFKYCMAVVMALSVAACQEDEGLLKPPALLSESSLTFEATGNEPQQLMIASDADWMIDVPVDWITIDPMAGSKTVYVSVSVADNVTDGVLNAPRSCKITIADKSGYSVSSMIYQKGDNYLGVSEMKISEIMGLKDEAFAKVAQAQVVAVATEGFVAADDSGLIVVLPGEDVQQDVQPGDMVYIAGQKLTYLDRPVLEAGEIAVMSSAEVSYPAAADITSQVDSYLPESIEYVKIDGTLVGNSLKNIPGMPTKSVTILPASASLDLEAVSVHKITLYAYHIGFDGSAHQLVAVSYKDNGADETIGVPFPFKDNFDWTAPFIEAANAVLPEASKINDAVALQTSSSDGAANIYTTLAQKGCMVLDELRSRGYVDLNPSFETIYLQDGYFKFSKGGKQSGLTLPLMQMAGEQDIVVQFKWCAHIGGSGAVDKTELVVAIEGPGTIVGSGDNPKISAPIKSTQQPGNMFWQDVIVNINGATSGTFITIRPQDEQFGVAGNEVTGYFRYHLDNISVMSVDDFVPAHMEVSGIEDDIMTFEGSPESPVSFKVLSDKDFTVETDVNWIDLSVTEGSANVETDVEVTCQESTLSELRKGVIRVKSGTSVHEIHVIQSAAGVALEPFLSIVGGNSGQVSFEEGMFNISVQSNVEYEVSSDAGWVTVTEVPQTRALVDIKQYEVRYQANADPAERTAYIRVFNTEENLESIFTLVQGAYVSGVIYQDDFTWVQPFVEKDNPEKQGDSMLDNKQYTPGTSYNLEGFETKLTELGYEALFPASKAIYVMKGNYLKFSKGKNINGLRLPKLDFNGENTVALSFDWGINEGANGPDPVQLEVTVEGNGTINGQKKTDALIHTAGSWEWQTEKIVITGVDNDTRITIRPTTFVGAEDATGKYYRWFLDNIMIAKASPFDAPSCTLSTFPFPDDPTFTGEGEGNGTKWNAAQGWLLSDDGKSKLSSHLKDGSELKFTYKYEAKKDSDVEGTKNHVRVLATGMSKDDYWLFEVPVKDAPAGTYNITYKQSASATGPNYFLMEVSVDGKNWMPVESQTTSETFKDGSSPRDVTWTYALNRGGNNAANVAYVVDVDYDAPAIAGNKTLYVRAKVADDMAYGSEKACGSKGTNRIWGPCEISFERK